MSELKDDLKAIHERLTRGWCQGTEAVDSEGEAVDVFSESACGFCLTGAIATTCNLAVVDIPTRWSDATAALLTSCTGGNLVDFNDSHTKDEVLALVQKAYEAAP